MSSQASWRMLLNAWWPALSASDALARLADPAVAEAVTPTGTRKPVSFSSALSRPKRIDVDDATGQ